jgi:hypothetical protein
LPTQGGAASFCRLLRRATARSKKKRGEQTRERGRAVATALVIDFDAPDLARRIEQLS